jgi:intein/homing endonuclease
MADSSFQELRNRSLFARLKRLFSNDVIVRNIGGKKLKVIDTDEIQFATDRNSLRDRFNRLRTSSYNQYTRDFNLSYQSSRVELFRDYDCVGPDTIIPLPDGSRPTIAELAEKYKDNPQERFYVWSYDHESKSIKLGKAYHPRSKGIQKTYKITFDNDRYIIATDNHLFLMRDETYKPVKDLRPNDSVMPFYQKDFFGRGYRHLYNFSKGWQTEHKIVAEQFYRPLNKDEVVHHINHIPSINFPENLQIMSAKAHSHFHSIKENNPFYGKKHSTKSNIKRSKTLKEVFKNRNQSLDKNPNYRKDITIDVLKIKATEFYKDHGKLTSWDLVKYVGCDYSLLQSRLKSINCDWKQFKSNITETLNHKIKSIEYYGEIEVYDLSVDIYNNFFTNDLCIHNCMDMDPILASALDIYADECVFSDTIIPLLNGDKIKIEDLYKQNKSNFWVYSVDETGNFSPQLCERVAYNGKKKMYKITLDDGTEIKCTKNHIWVKSDNTQIFAQKLKVGDSLKVFNTKLSDSKFMPGYEMLLDGDGKWKYTHRVVANSVEKLINEKKLLLSKNKVVHHSSFNKLNNSPEYLQWLDYNEHRSVHSKFNKELWSDTSKTHEYKQKIILGHEKYWTESRRLNVSNRQKQFMKKFLETLTDDDKNKMYGNSGRKNGMFGMGHLLEKNKNGRWKGFSDLSTVDTAEYESDIISGMSTKELRIKYNLNRKNANLLNKEICKKYNIYGIYQLKRKLELATLYDGISIPMIKFYAQLEISNGKNILRDLTPISKKFDISNKELFNFIKNNGYSGIKDLVDSNNHRIISIEELEGEYDAYDLVNVGKSSHLYAVECKDGSKLITHNCSTRNEMGDIITVRSNNDEIKNILNNLFYDILNIEFNLWSWTRSLVKYGDFYLKLHISPEYGVYLVEPLSTYYVTRIENADLKNKNFVRFQVNMPYGNKIEECENYQIAHFRLLSDSNFLPYGKSSLEGARRVWKQLSLMEDAMLIHRIMRAPEKRIFKIDIGNIPPNEVDNHMERIINQMKKVPYIDDQTGDYNLRFNLQNMVEDFFLPVRGGDSGTSIENLSGLEWTGTDDIEYLRNKMMAALKIPKAFLGYDESLCVSPDTKIPLLNGIEKSVKELIDDYNNGVKNYVYSIDETTKNIVPGEIEWAGYTRKNADVVRVWLDNNKYIDCTPDHKFMTRDGEWVDAINLKPDQSLMPLYTKKSDKKSHSGYEMVYHPSTGKYQEVHRLVAEHYNLIQKGSGKVVHHKDFNKLNNYPENFDCSMLYWEHRSYHSKLTQIGINSPENIKKRVNDPKWRQSVVNAGRLGGIKSSKHLSDYARTHSPVNKGSRSGYNKKCPVCDNTFYTIKSLNSSTCSMNCSKIYFVGDKRYNVKFTSISLDKLISVASSSISFKDLQKKLGNIDRNTLNKLFVHHGFINKLDFIMKYMPRAVSNVGFMNNFNKVYKNHKVVRVEILKEKIDTCDITVKHYHNFATSAGVIIHNSGKATLAAEDIRFARTIQRIQRIIVSELNKVAVIHLYSQGYRDESLVDFSLELTNPSTIFEKEKIDVWKSKVEVSKDMAENKLFSKKWVYENVFGLSDHDMIELQKQLIDDAKGTYRFKQIEDEGNDPALSFLKSKDKEGDVSADAGEGGSSGELGGGPDKEPTPETPDSGAGEESSAVEPPKLSERDQTGRKKASDYPFGEDPLGTLENNRRSDLSVTHKYKNKSPLSLEALSGLNDLLNTVDDERKILREGKSNSFMDETNIKE